MNRFIEILNEKLIKNRQLGRKSLEAVLEDIKQAEAEYKGGWIPCSSGNFSTSEVLVCKEDGTIDFDVFDFMNEDWKFNSNHHKNKVLAWQPLPEAFKEGDIKNE